jgi:spermidine synthase
MDYDFKLAIESAGFVRENACSSEIVSLYPVSRVLWAKKTKYAEAILAECPGLGKTLFLDNEIQSAEHDEHIYHECLVHPVMVAAPSRQKVLIVGGGEGATAREVLRWPDVEKVMWIDIDKELVQACQEHLGWLPEGMRNDERLIYKGMDIRDFLHLNEEPYNVVILDLPDPDIRLSVRDPANLQNLAFWRGIRKSMTADAVFATHVGPTRLPGDLDPFEWMMEGAKEAGIPVNPGKYHAMIPSFQNDWSFLMSCKPRLDRNLPEKCQFLNPVSHRYIFTWPY